MTIPQRINQLRRNGYSQCRIAEELNVSPSYVSRYFAGVKARRECDVAADVRRMLAEAKTEAEKRCIMNNFGNFLEAK